MRVRRAQVVGEKVYVVVSVVIWKREGERVVMVGHDGAAERDRGERGGRGAGA